MKKNTVASLAGRQNHPSTTPSLHHSVGPFPNTPSLHHSSPRPSTPPWVSSPVVSSPVVSRPPRYALRKGLNAWELTFEGKHAVLRHEQGIHYVAYLLLNPPAEPIHALDLAIRIAAIHRKQAGLPEIVDPVTARYMPLQSGARLQERSLALDDAQTMRATLRQQNKLEAILEDPLTFEPVKEEVQRELIALYRYEERNTARTLDTAQKCVRAVRMAIRRFHDHLATAVDAQGQPHPVLRAFAAHINRYVLLPSARYSDPAHPYARAGISGRFTYECPGVKWV